MNGIEVSRQSSPIENRILPDVDQTRELAEPLPRYSRPARIPSKAPDASKRAVQQWLATHSGMLEGVVWSMVASASPKTREVNLKASWPKPAPPRKSLKVKILRCAARGKPIVLKVPTVEGAPPNLLVFYPLENCNREGPPLILVLEMTHRNEEQYCKVEKQLRWNSQWLHFLLYNQLPKGAAAETGEIISIANGALDQTQFRGTAMALVTQLAGRHDCERVSLGLQKRGQMDVKIVSHSARFKHQSNLIQAIAAAMEEAGDQDRVISYPAHATAASVSHAHVQLVKAAGIGAVTTIPISVNKEIVGALCLERNKRRPLTPVEIKQIEQLLELITPTLWLRYQDERPILTKIRHSARNTLAKVLGPADIKLKLVSLLVPLLILFFSFAQGTWNVGAEAVIEGKVQRSIAAPIDGYIASVEVRPGDSVKAKQAMGSLDDGDLVLERLKWSTLRQQMVSEAREAMAQRDRAQLSIINAKIAQADAELKLIEEQLARTQLQAPFDGVVIAGDLSQSLGTPVSRGDVLFKVAPLNDYRIVLNVDEHDIGAVEKGHFGRLRLASMPGRPIMMRVDKITPVSTAADGGNYFRVEASLLEPDLQLQPGMEGVGKISVGEANLFWLWTRELSNWLRVKTWTWWR